MNSLIWIIVIFVVQAIIAGLAKKAQQKQEAERQARSAQPGQAPKPAARTPQPAPAPEASDDPIAVARREIDAQIAARREPRAARGSVDVTAARQPAAKVVRPIVVAPAPKQGAKPSAKPVQKPTVLARGGAQPAPIRPTVLARPSSVQASVKPSKSVVAKPTPVREEAAAMASRARVTASVEAVRAAERRVDSPILGKGPQAVRLSRPAVALSPAAIAAAVRDPARIREAFVIGEILQGPRSMRPI